MVVSTLRDHVQRLALGESYKLLDYYPYKIAEMQIKQMTWGTRWIHFSWPATRMLSLTHQLCKIDAFHSSEIAC